MLSATATHFLDASFKGCGIPGEHPVSNAYKNRINNYCLTKKQRFDNGYPMDISGWAMIQPNEYQANRKMFVEEDDCLRVCTRCEFTFGVEKCGFQKKSAHMVCQDREGNWYNFHIHDQQPVKNLKNFRHCPPVIPLFNECDSGKLYGIDVEMVYTSRGQSVGRVTMVDENGTIFVDQVVKQEDEVYDPVTKYSGLTMEDLKQATWTFEEVREQIIRYTNKESILVGHGLYGDLKALHIIHEKVIDTSVLFTNNGRRPSLRHLTSVYLDRQIQNCGHCSLEDAIASLELVFYGAMYPECLAPMYQQF